MKTWYMSLIIIALTLGIALLGFVVVEKTFSSESTAVLQSFATPGCAWASTHFSFKNIGQTGNAAKQLAEEQICYNKHIQWLASSNPTVGPTGDATAKLVGGADDAGNSWSYDKNELQGIVRQFASWNDELGSCRFIGAGKGDVVKRLDESFACCNPIGKDRSLCHLCGLKCLAGGSYGVAFFEFQGIKKGSVKIHFIYKRLWEKNEPPLKTADYVLTVDAKGHVTASKQ
jgi:hypothetical protein